MYEVHCDIGRMKSLKMLDRKGNPARFKYRWRANLSIWTTNLMINLFESIGIIAYCGNHRVVKID